MRSFSCHITFIVIIKIEARTSQIQILDNIFIWGLLIIDMDENLEVLKAVTDSPS